MVMLRIAAALAAVAVFIGALYLRYSGENNHTPIVVATQDIAAGALISPDMIQTAFGGRNLLARSE